MKMLLQQLMLLQLRLLRLMDRLLLLLLLWFLFHLERFWSLGQVLLVQVRLVVLLEVRLLPEAFAAEIARERLFARVHPHVHIDRVFVLERFRADRAVVQRASTLLSSTSTTAAAAATATTTTTSCR